MKIAILNIYQNKVNRGAETFVSELSKRLSKKHNVEVISKVNYLKLLTSKYDLVIPTNGRWQAVLVKLISLLKGYKIIISGQSGIGFDDRLNLYTFPNYFIALSDFALEWAKKINPFIKVVKIPNGVDLNKFKTEKLDNTNNGLKTVLAVGAFTKNKRHDLTIKAVAKLKNVNLVIAGGGGELKHDIKILGKKLLGEDRFKVIQTTQDKMPEVYKRANLLVFPTVPWESFGITVVEAMSCNLPVVASDDPIRREIVGDAGIFVDPNCIDEYAKAIDKALNINWGNKPNLQSQKFNWDIIGEKYESVISMII